MAVVNDGKNKQLSNYPFQFFITDELSRQVEEKRLHIANSVGVHESRIAVPLVFEVAISRFEMVYRQLDEEVWRELIARFRQMKKQPRKRIVVMCSQNSRATLSHIAYWGWSHYAAPRTQQVAAACALMFYLESED